MHDMKFGIIGLGGWVVGGHLPALTELGIKVDYCVDIDEKRVKDFSQKTGCKGYTDYKEMLRNENPDLVLIAVPHSLHASIALDAINNDANVYVEKPMATSFSEALNLAEASRKRNKLLIVGHEYRFDQPVLIAKKLIMSGEVGKIYHMRGFYIRQRGIPTSPTFLKKDLAKGGVVFDIGSHIVDLLLFLSGFPIPRSVTAKTHNIFSEDKTKFSVYPSPTLPNFKIEVEDFGSAYLNFDDISAYIEVSWASYIKENRREMVILGNKGGIHIENATLNFIKNITDELFISSPLISQQRGSLYREVWKTVMDSLSKGTVTYPLCTVEQGAIDIAILEGIYKSASENREVKLDIPEWLIRQSQQAT
ncbi:Gfo/Idh/MocA family oxidoreductase [Sulfolobus tengchongensis]|uniref:Gfo/Idh/MocA family oxidoreductase n=1 Tax=Sulfolobus tengchongensis TaxID=207809 RepID=A0AAX4L3Z1_9CREN